VSFEGGEGRTKSGKLRGRKTPTDTVVVMGPWMGQGFSRVGLCQTTLV